MITSLIGIDLLDLPLCHNRSTDSCEDFFSSLGPSFDAIKNPVGLLAAWFAVNGV